MLNKLNELLKGGVDPKWMVLLGFVINIQKGIGQGAISLTNMVPDSWIPHIVAWNNGLAWAGLMLMTALAALSSSNSGPLISVPNLQLPSIDAAKTIVKVLLVAFALSFLVAGGSAQAVTLTGNAQADLAAARAAKAKPAPQSPTDVLTKIMNDISKVKAEVITGTVADITAADADAATLLNSTDPASFKDPIAHACYPAEIKFLQSLPSADAPTGSYVLVQLFQRKRDFVAQLQAGIPAYLKLGCAALLGDEIQILTKSLALVGVTLGANMLLPGSGILTMPPLF